MVQSSSSGQMRFGKFKELNKSSIGVLTILLILSSVAQVCCKSQEQKDENGHCADEACSQPMETLKFSHDPKKDCGVFLDPDENTNSPPIPKEAKLHMYFKGSQNMLLQFNDTSQVAYITIADVKLMTCFTPVSKVFSKTKSTLIKARALVETRFHIRVESETPEELSQESKSSESDEKDPTSTSQTDQNSSSSDTKEIPEIEEPKQENSMTIETTDTSDKIKDETPENGNSDSGLTEAKVVKATENTSVTKEQQILSEDEMLFENMRELEPERGTISGEVDAEPLDENENFTTNSVVPPDVDSSAFDDVITSIADPETALPEKSNLRTESHDISGLKLDSAIKPEEERQNDGFDKELTGQPEVVSPNVEERDRPLDNSKSDEKKVPDPQAIGASEEVVGSFQNDSVVDENATVLPTTPQKSPASQTVPAKDNGHAEISEQVAAELPQSTFEGDRIDPHGSSHGHEHAHNLVDQELAQVQGDFGHDHGGHSHDQGHEHDGDTHDHVHAHDYDGHAHDHDGHDHAHDYDGHAHDYDGHAHDHDGHDHEHAHDYNGHAHEHDGHTHNHGHAYDHDGHTHDHGHAHDHDGRAHDHDGHDHGHAHDHDGHTHDHGHAHNHDGHAHNHDGHAHDHIHTHHYDGNAHDHDGHAHYHHFEDCSSSERLIDEGESSEERSCSAVPRYLRHILPMFLLNQDFIFSRLVQTDKMIAVFDLDYITPICKKVSKLSWVCQEKVFEMPLWFWVLLCLPILVTYWISLLLKSVFKEKDPLAMNVHNVEKRNLALLKEHAIMKRQIDSFDSEKAEFAEEYKKLRTAFDGVRDEKVQLMNAVAEFKQESNQAHELIAKLEASQHSQSSLLRQKEMDYLELKKQFEEECINKNNMEQDLLQMHRKLASFSSSCESLQSHNESLQKQLDDKTIECQTHRQNAKHLQATIDQLEGQKFTTVTQLNEKDNMIKEKQDEVHSLQQNIQLLKRTLASQDVQSLMKKRNRSEGGGATNNSEEGWDDFDVAVDDEDEVDGPQMEKIEEIFNAAKIKDELDALKQVHRETMDRLGEQTDRVAAFEARALAAESKQSEASRVLKEKSIEFEVIKRYWTSTEEELRKQISEMQLDSLQKEQKLSNAETMKHSATETCETYKQKADDLKLMLEKSDARHKDEISKLDKSLHLYWTKSRSLEQKVEMLSRENTHLRKRLTQVDPDSVPEEKDREGEGRKGSSSNNSKSKERGAKSGNRKSARTRRSDSPSYTDEWLGFDPPTFLPPPPPFFPMMGMAPPNQQMMMPPQPMGGDGFNPAVAANQNTAAFFDSYMHYHSPQYQTGGGWSGDNSSEPSRDVNSSRPENDGGIETKQRSERKRQQQQFHNGPLSSQAAHLSHQHYPGLVNNSFDLPSNGTHPHPAVTSSHFNPIDQNQSM